MNKLILLALCSIAVLASARAQAPHTPGAGSPERKAIMDVLRVPCERDLKQKVIFKVDHLRVVGSWAFARVVPLRLDGTEIDYSKTRYRADQEEGAFDAEGEALLRREGKEWRLLEWRFGASDTEAEIWMEKYRAPWTLVR